MLSAANFIEKSIYRPCYQFRLAITIQLRHFITDSRSPSSPSRRRTKPRPTSLLKKDAEDKSEWWIVDGEMHEIGDNVPIRERFLIPRENIPNKRRKQLRDQYMRRTRLVMMDSKHESWCVRYMELYNELRENWERLYWDEGYYKKLAQAHANQDTSEDEDEDFNPNMRRQSFGNQTQGQGFARQGNFIRQQEGNGWQNVSQIRDKFEYDRERRMREKAFAPIGGGHDFNTRGRGGEGDDFNTRGRGGGGHDFNTRGRGDDFNTRGRGGEGDDFNTRGRGGEGHDFYTRGRGGGGGGDDGFKMYDSNSRNNTPLDAKIYAFESGSESE